MVNEEEKQFYNHLYSIFLYCGCGWTLNEFTCYANSEQQAVEIVVAFIEKSDINNLLWNIEEVSEEHEESYIYIDATMEGASRPYYVLAENFNIILLK